MNQLASLIDKLPQPDFPDFFDEQDRLTLLLYWESAKKQARPYTGEFKADWLLSDFDAHVWITRNRGREELIAGYWQGTADISWDVMLPDGHLLSAPMYDRLLKANMKIAFLSRCGYLGPAQSIVPWKQLISTQLLLSRWLVLHERQFLPKKYGFSLLDQSSFDSLFCEFGIGNWAGVLRINERLLETIYQKVFEADSCPQHLYESIYDLPNEIKLAFITWFGKHKFYQTGTKSKGKSVLSRARLAGLINEEIRIVSTSERSQAFIRQFEPDFETGSLLFSGTGYIEYPRQSTPTLQEVVESSAAESSVANLASRLKTIMMAHRHLPDLLPEPGTISISDAKIKAEKYTQTSGHTAFIPVDTGLTYLNLAMRFVHVYGAAIIDYYLGVIKVIEMIPGDSAVAGKKAWVTEDGIELSQMFRLEREFQKLKGTFTVNFGGKERPIEDVLGIKEFSYSFDENGVRKQIDFNLFRKHPSLEQALQVLIGACIVCIAIIKPSREAELTHLKRNCLFDDANGYWISFELGKSNALDTYLEKRRPIPVITARAIQLLQKFGDALSEQWKDKRNISNNLFYISKFKGFSPPQTPKSHLLNDYLDVFCDYVGLPPDGLTRRWYVRIHEMRKWFLILLFWSGRYGVLDAARWIAGHVDAEHIYAYIEREFPGEELPKVEAQYSVDRLRCLNSGATTKEGADPGLYALYDLVLKHFGVESLSMIPESEWAEYVTVLRQMEGFHLEPHSVYSDSDSEVTGITVSFVLREATP